MVYLITDEDLEEKDKLLQCAGRQRTTKPHCIGGKASISSWAKVILIGNQVNGKFMED